MRKFGVFIISVLLFALITLLSLQKHAGTGAWQSAGFPFIFFKVNEHVDCLACPVTIDRNYLLMLLDFSITLFVVIVLDSLFDKPGKRKSE